MTFNIYYTETEELDSSFVDQAWYDGTTNRLVLDLNDTVYEYYDVQPATYHDLVNAPSAGTFYRKNIQGARHGNRLGNVWDAVEVKRRYADTTKAETVVVSDNRQGAPTSDLLNVARVTLTTSAPVTDAWGKVDLDYTLQFVIHDGDEVSNERSHTLKATSLDEAIEQMFGLAEVLDQEIELKGASVRFD